MPEKTAFLPGKNVSLHLTVPDDAPRILAWLNDPEVRKLIALYLPWGELEEREHLAERHKKKERDLMFAMVTSEGTHIGNMGLHAINWKDRTATTGALIGDKSFWGKGLGTEAKMLLLEYAFNTLNLRKICSRVYAGNGRSLRYGEKCGYREEGLLRKEVFKDGEYTDVVLTAVFREDWLPLWEEFRKKL